MSSAEFLSRWSRRKRGARRDAQRESEPAAEREPIAEAAADPAAAEGEAEITPEEVAALPRIEDLTPDTDITAFLRKGVPEVLKNAALRRMWSLDPAIRDYVSEAREYAYDWNVPGGVPGNGPLLPTDDVGAMLGRIFGDDDREPETAMPGSPPRVGLSHQREPELPAAPPPEARTSPALRTMRCNMKPAPSKLPNPLPLTSAELRLKERSRRIARGRVVHRKKPTSLTPRTRLGRAVMAEPRQFEIPQNYPCRWVIASYYGPKHRERGAFDAVRATGWKCERVVSTRRSGRLAESVRWLAGWEFRSPPSPTGRKLRPNGCWRSRR